jgi:hypothetical protein
LKEEGILMMKNVAETIKKRSSIRTYDGAIENEKLHQIQDYLASNVKGPFGNQVRFQLIDVTEAEKSELKQLGTYGLIKGAHLFIAGAVTNNAQAMEDFGYCMEKNILTATALGLGTCWLGGALNRSTFAIKINASENEVIPAVTPLGYPAEKRTVMDSLVRTIAGSKKRQEFGTLFFLSDQNTPLDKLQCGKYAVPLESVRLAPSASNKQPWRVIKENEHNIFHFYLKENAIYNNMIKGIKIQNLDLGIALCHFELAARELDLTGAWEVKEPKPPADGLKYIASWIG